MARRTTSAHQQDEIKRLLHEARNREITERVAWPTKPQLPVTVDDMNAAIEWDLSPQCSLCRWHEPGGGRYCAAYPASRRVPIPNEIYSGEYLHVTEVGDEQEDAETGTPIMFEPVPDPEPGDDADADTDDE